VPTLNDLPPGLEQSIMLMVEEFPDVFDGFDKWFSHLCRIVQEGGKIWALSFVWHHRSRGLDMLAKVVERKAGESQLDGEPTAKM
jgi:hypothetical protein